MGKKVTETIFTPPGTLVWAYLDKPDTSKQGKNKFKSSLALDKGVKANDALVKKLNDLHKSVGGKRDKQPVKDGDAYIEDAPDAEAAQKREWARGKWIIGGKSKDKPKVVAADGKTQITVAPNSGDYGRLSLYATDYDVDGSKGVACYLNGVQLLERRNHGRDGTAGFGDMSDEYSNDTAEAATRDGTGDDDGSSDGDGDGGDY